jgi:hypothetical protein
VMRAPPASQILHLARSPRRARPATPRRVLQETPSKHA